MSRASARAIEAQAAEWVVRLDRDGECPLLRAQLDAWLGKDERCAGAFLQAQAAWRLLHEPGDLTEALPPAATAAQGRWSRRALMGLGVSAIAASVAGLFLVWPEKHFETQVGEVRRIPLADGSVIAINVQSDVAVSLRKDVRLLRITRGEAFVQVAKDRERPFIAEAGKVRVRAVGTGFSVERRDDGALVMVSEGVVEAWVDGAEGNFVRIVAGQQAYVADNAAITRQPSTPDSIERALAWRSGRIDLAGETLAQAVAEFNRYNLRKIVLIDSRLGQEPLYGVFRLDDPEGFARTIRHGFDVPISLSASGEIVIGRTI
jgi:transmembrane sensor